MNDLEINQDNTIDINEIKIPSGFSKKVKDEYKETLIVLQERSLLFKEDVPIIQGAYEILNQSEKVLKDIKRIETFIKTENDVNNMLKLDNNLSKNRSLYSRLINQHTIIMEKFFSTPNKKMEVLKSVQRDDDKKNPILAVLGGGRNG